VIARDLTYEQIEREISIASKIFPEDMVSDIVAQELFHELMGTVEYKDISAFRKEINRIATKEGYRKRTNKHVNIDSVEL